MHVIEENQLKNNFQNRGFTLLKLFWMMYILFPFRLKGIAGIQNIFYYGVSIFCVGLFIYKLYHIQINKKYFVNFILFILVFLILMVLTYIIPIKKNTLDFSYLSNYGYFLGRLLIMLGSVVLAKNVFEYIKLLIDSVNLYILFSIVLLIPSFHSFYFNLLVIDANGVSRIQELYSQNYYTRFGLQGYSGFGSTIMCSIVVLLCCYMVVVSVSQHQKVYPYIIRMFLSLFGTVLYGRSGFLISVVIIMVTILYLTLFYGKLDFLLSTIGLMLILTILFVLNADKLQQIDSIRWMFEGFFNYLNYGHFSTASSNELKGMYIHPSFQTFMVGDGLYTVAGLYYMNTDVGFLRPLLFWGIFGEIVYYLLLLPPLIVCRNFLKNVNGNFLMFISILFIVMFEFKGETLLTFSSIFFALMSIILLTGTSYYRKNSRY